MTDLTIAWAPTGRGLHVHQMPGRPARQNTAAIETAHIHDGLGAHTHTAADNGMPRWHPPDPDPADDPDLYAPPGMEWEFELSQPGRGPILSYHRHLLHGLMNLSVAHDLTAHQVAISCVAATRGVPDPAPHRNHPIGQAVDLPVPLGVRPDGSPVAAHLAPSRDVPASGKSAGLPTYPPLDRAEARAIEQARDEEVDIGGHRSVMFMLPDRTRPPIISGLLARGMVAPLTPGSDETRFYLTARGLGAHYRMRQTSGGPAGEPRGGDAEEAPPCLTSE